LCTSDTNNTKIIKKTAFIYAAVTVICLIVANIYALFGHGIRSPYMDYMFICPLSGGIIFFFLGIINKKTPSQFGRELYHSGIATATAGLMLKGIVRIAGTDSPYIFYFWVLGVILLLIGIILLLFL